MGYPRRPEGALQALLALPAETLVAVRAYHIHRFGREIALELDTAGHPNSAGAPLLLRYAECREHRWRVYALDDDQPAEVVDFAPGRDQHRSPMQMLTTRFALFLVYGALHIERP
jgi:hypothetical protein